MKRTISALLLIAMLASVSCESAGTGNDITSDDTTVSESTETSAETNDRENVKDNLPETDFGGDKFTMLVRTERSYEFEAEEENGDLLNDAVYKRNLAVEDRFNIKFDNVLMDSVWGDQATQFTNSLRASIQAGEGAYDIVASYAATIPALVSQGLFANWSDMKYVDFSKPWWSEKVKDEMTINGKCFMITGDISLALWEGMCCVMFNKKLADNYGIGNMYDLVKEGNWTFDKMLDITKDRYQDLDGDGEVSDNDAFGMIHGTATEVDNYKEAFEIPVTKRGDDGYPEFALKSEKIVDVLTRLDAWVWNSNDVYWELNLDRPVLQEIFSRGNSLLFNSTLGATQNLRDMKDDFGIIPYPKYDENQKDYHSTSLDEFSMFVIPIDAPDMDKTAFITEALCAESYKKVVPVFYDVVLKTKNARDNDSAQMIDIIRDGLVFDWGYIYSGTMGQPGHQLAILLKAHNTNIASEFDKKAKAYEKNLEKALKVYRGEE